jgi:hypothetical protein
MRKLFIVLLVAASLLMLGCAAEVKQVEEKWNDAQIKLTWVGPQKKVVPSTGIACGEFDLSLFKGKGGKGIDYSNDDIALGTVKVSADEMKAILTNPIIIGMKTEGEPVLSYMFYNATSGKVSEKLLDREDAYALVNEIEGSIGATEELGPYLSLTKTA